MPNWGFQIGIRYKLIRELLEFVLGKTGKVHQWNCSSFPSQECLFQIIPKPWEPKFSLHKYSKQDRVASLVTDQSQWQSTIRAFSECKGKFPEFRERCQSVRKCFLGARESFLAAWKLEVTEPNRALHISRVCMCHVSPFCNWLGMFSLPWLLSKLCKLRLRLCWSL